MNKNHVIAIVVIAACIVLGVAIYVSRQSARVSVPAGQEAPGSSSESPDNPEAQVRKVVAEFGAKMRNVSLAAPTATIVQAIREHYGPFVSGDLLAAWEAEPEKAPGRTASSPWPDHIEIAYAEPEDDGAYVVEGKVIEVTSAEVAGGGTASEYQVGMKLRNRDGKWIITGFTKAIPL